MGKTIYSKCVDLCNGLEKGLLMPASKLRANIMVKIGGQPRTIKNAITVMIETKLIQDIGNCHFKIL
jgi:hypothetical protein